MQVETFEYARDFLAQAKPWLERNEAANALMMGVVGRVARNPAVVTAQPYLAIVTDADRLLMAAMMTPPFKLVLSYVENPDSAVIEAIARDLQATAWTVPGVLATPNNARMFAEIWAKVAGQTYKQGMCMRAFALTAVIPPIPMPPGYLRQVTVEDRDLLARWIAAFHDDTGLRDPVDPQELAARIVCERTVYIWEDSGPVSIAARIRPTDHGTSIGLVYTPPEARGKGYASANVAALSQLCLDSGYTFCSLFTDLANPTSNSIYQKIGYRPVCDFTEYYFSL